MWVRKVINQAPVYIKKPEVAKHLALYPFCTLQRSKMVFLFAGGDSQAYSYTGLGPLSNASINAVGKETCCCCSSIAFGPNHNITFPKPQPAPPPSVFDFSNTNLTNFTNFPTAKHNYETGMAKGPAAVAQPPWFLPVMILPIMPVLISGGFPGSVTMAPPFTESTKAPVFGHACKSCSAFPTTLSAATATDVGSSAFPRSAIIGGPSSNTANTVEFATLHQPTYFGGQPFSAAPVFTGGPSSSNATATPQLTTTPFGGPSTH